jgi:deazaflavin-dependent oxidoreductase (nitroreductase family)
MDEETLRQSFRYFNQFMLFLWRLGLGPWLSLWPQVTGRYLVITHTGRKSGLRHQTPVNYAVVNDEVYCAAGFGSISDWFRNIKANPQVEVWLQDSWWAGEAEEITSPELRLPLLRAVIIDSGFAGPMFGVDARQPDDQQFTKATQDYRLIHIKRLQARTGPGGPGDLAWVWLLATFLLLPLAFRRKKRK